MCAPCYLTPEQMAEAAEHGFEPRDTNCACCGKDMKYPNYPPTSGCMMPWCGCENGEEYGFRL